MLLLLILCTATSCQSVTPIQTAPDEQTYSGTLSVGIRRFPAVDEPYPPYRRSSYEEVLQEKSLAFMEKHPGVNIEFVNIDYSRDFSSLLDNPQSMPDIIQLTVNEARFAMLPHIESLAERIEDHAAAWEGDYRKLIELAEIDGEPYLLPITSDPMLVYYKPDIFAAEQIAEPRDGWTFGEYAEIVGKLAAKGYAVHHPETLNDMEPFITGLGGAYMSPDRRSVSGYLDSEATAEAFVQFADMIPEIPDLYEKTAVLRVYRSTVQFRDIFQDHYAIAPLPSDWEGRRYNNALITGFAISKTSVQPELAWAYMTFLLGETSEEAVDFVVNHTHENYGTHMRIGRKPIYEEMIGWLRSEILHAPAASFDMIWYDHLSRKYPIPQRTLEQIRSYTDMQTAQADLARWAKELETGAPFLAAAGGNSTH